MPFLIQLTINQTGITIGALVIQEKTMHKLTSKRQVTLPQAVCKAIALQPGDFVEVFARDGIAHIVKMNSNNIAGKFHDLIKEKTFPSAEEISNALKTRAANKFLADDSD
jgi:bifunctional DNA-binding transcriptional regulator/antitoxin component of YhaV-PrlF toxin-antitoxin module